MLSPGLKVNENYCMKMYIFNLVKENTLAMFLTVYNYFIFRMWFKRKT